MCQIAADEAREKTIKELVRYKVTPGRVAKRLAEALDAHDVRVFHDKATGEIVYSKPLVAHGVRLKAVEISTVLLEMKPAEKHDVNLTGDLGLYEKLQEARQRAAGKRSENKS